jgi:predicted anti-sigma-YlaC factor YlaD
MTDVTCASGVSLLMDYLEGNVAPDLRAALEEHVNGCAGCRAFIESYRATPRILREATIATFPPELERSLMAFLRSRRL